MRGRRVRKRAGDRDPFFQPRDGYRGLDLSSAVEEQQIARLPSLLNAPGDARGHGSELAVDRLRRIDRKGFDLGSSAIAGAVGDGRNVYRERRTAPAPGRRHHDGDRTGAVTLRDRAETRGIAGYRLPRADVAQVLQVSGRDRERHQPVGLGKARPGLAPRVGPVPQQVHARHSQHRKHQPRLRSRDREPHAAAMQESANRGPVELKRQPRQIAHPGGLLPVHLEALHQGRYAARLQRWHGPDRGLRHDPFDQAAEGDGMAFRQRDIARLGGVLGRGVDRHVADQKHRSVAGKRRPGHRDRNQKRREPDGDGRRRHARLTPALRWARH